MSVAVQTVERIGRWSVQAVVQSYLSYLDPKGMLGLGEWPEATQGNFKLFWAERFHMRVSPRLQAFVYPFQAEVLHAPPASLACLLLGALMMACDRVCNSCMAAW